MSVVGDYIYKARQEQQISIRYLAKLTGISHSEINKIENGERVNPSPLHLKAIATVLGLNQISCLRKAGYIDEGVYETPPKIPSKCSQNEINEEKEEVNIMSNGIKVASLFAGIGGICYGF